MDVFDEPDHVVHPPVGMERGEDRQRHTDQERQEHAVADQGRARTEPLAEDLRDRRVERERASSSA